MSNELKKILVHPRQPIGYQADDSLKSHLLHPKKGNVEVASPPSNARSAHVALRWARTIWNYEATILVYLSR